MSKKHVIVGAVILIAGYWMFTDPSGLATFSKEGADQGLVVAGNLMDGLISFIKQMS